MKAVIILAAGRGERLKSSQPKVLHYVGGRPILDYVLRAAQQLAAEHIAVVVGHGREHVQEHLADVASHVDVVVQEKLTGSADAVALALQQLHITDGHVAVIFGDAPMLDADCLQIMAHQHDETGAHMTVLTAYVDHPTGCARVIRNQNDHVLSVLRHDVAGEMERAIREVAAGAFMFDVTALTACLPDLAQAEGEHYVADIASLATKRGLQVSACLTDDRWRATSVESRVHVAQLNKELNRRACERWMEAGVTIIDPDTTWIHDTVDLAPDVTLLPGTMLEGATSIAAGAVIGPETLLRDCEVGEDAEVVRSHCILAMIGPRVKMGPYVYLRPGTELADGSHVGTFVEIKNSKIGEGAKVPHLCYCGDAIVDEGANIGAGTIFANYDGAKKWKTHVGRYSFVGSNSVLVAPVDIADGAYTAAGSTITEDVPAGAIAIARGRQHVSEGWVAKRRAGAKSDAAASGASGEIHPAVAESRAKQQN